MGELVHERVFVGSCTARACEHLVVSQFLEGEAGSGLQPGDGHEELGPRITAFSHVDLAQLSCPAVHVLEEATVDGRELAEVGCYFDRSSSQFG